MYVRAQNIELDCYSSDSGPASGYMILDKLPTFLVLGFHFWFQGSK